MLPDTHFKNYRILVVDDEQRMAKFIHLNLEHDGFRVVEAFTGTQAMDRLRTSLPDLVLLDVMLPDLDGFEVLKMIRAISPVPVIMVTAKGEEEERIHGLELGADDYVTKPFSPRELLARIKAILRRIKGTQGQIDVCCFGDVEIDFKKYEVKKKGQPVYLTSLEFSLIGFLIKHKDQVVDRSIILDEVWGKDVYVLPKTVDTHVGHLRKKIEDDPANPKHIIGVRGTGYRFIA
jgi:DNA-binding response OmpR family regulator